MGKCPDCGSWDALEEHRVDASAAKDPQRGLAREWVTAPEAGEEAGAAPKAVPIAEAREDAGPMRRISTGIGELDRVLGGAASEVARHSVPGARPG